MIWADCAKEEKEMLHKYENFLGLPEDSLVYEREVREENAHYFCTKDSTSKRDTPKEVFGGHTYRGICKDGGH